MGRGMARRVLVFGLILLTAGRTASARDNCKPIHFPPDRTSTVIKGTTAPTDSDEVTCYTFVAGAGQTAILTVSKNMAMSIIDVADDRDNFSFKTEAKTYTVNVFEDSRSATRDPFTLTISIQ